MNVGPEYHQKFYTAKIFIFYKTEKCKWNHKHAYSIGTPGDIRGERPTQV